MSIIDTEEPDDLVEYQDSLDIMYQREKLSRLKKDFFTFQPSITPMMIKRLTKWFIETCANLYIHMDTLLLAVYLLNKILSFVRVSRRNLPLLGTTILYMSDKIKEDWQDLSVGDFVKATDFLYSDEEIFNMERIVLKKLDWNINIPIPTDFITVYCTNDFGVKCFDVVVMTLFGLIIDTDIIVDYLPSTIAYSAMIVSRRMQGITPEWNEELEQQTRYKYEDLVDCVEKLYLLYMEKSERRDIVDEYINNLILWAEPTD